MTQGSKHEEALVAAVKAGALLALQTKTLAKWTGVSAYVIKRWREGKVHRHVKPDPKLAERLRKAFLEGTEW